MARVIRVFAGGATMVAASCAMGQFQTFQGNAGTEQAWRLAAAGGSPIPLETFESYQGVPSPFSGPSDQVTHLASLGLVLYGEAPGTYPGVYSNASQAHSGVNQIANFGGGGGNSSNYFAEPESGLAIHAMGFWQCDPQGNVVFEAFAGNVLVGTITGLINNGSGNSFAGFVSDVPITRIKVRGDEGDGWNHTDDWQVIVVHGACYPNCDGSTVSPVLTANDFQCFLNKFASNDVYANCDGSTATPLLTANDFQCFLNAFATGCS